MILTFILCVIGLCFADAARWARPAPLAGQFRNDAALPNSIDALRRRLRSDPGDIAIRQKLALALLQEGTRDEARRHAREAARRIANPAPFGFLELWLRE